MGKEKKKKEKSGKNLIGIKILAVLILLVAAFIYYYVTLPAVNIHSVGFWWFIIGAVIMVTTVGFFWKSIKEKRAKIVIVDSKTAMGPWKYGYYLAVVLVIIFAIGTFLGSPIINAKKYQSLLDVETRIFTEDISQVDYDTIPLLDKASASLLGDRKMGSMVDMVSQFEVADDYSQINYKGKPVRVTPLEYASPIKWFTNQKDGIPAYILIDMATQNTECIKLSEGIKYSKSEYFNRNIYRHLRFHYPTAIFADQIFFEIDEEGIPYWICPIKKFNVGLFGGETVDSVVICNAISGECEKYKAGEVPQWVDKVYQAELLMNLYDYSGIYKHGYFNSILGQKDCLQTTNGYNYIALEDDVWVYSGVTSVNGDQSNVGFVLMNQRTMETRFYQVEGAIEDSAMASAEGQVQNLGYSATFPLLLNIADEPTYFMALKDESGLVKKYAMVNIGKYQWVAIGDTVKECEKEYNRLLNTNGIAAVETGTSETITGKLSACASIVIEGNTHFYLSIEGREEIFDVDITNPNVLNIVKYNPGDRITITYMAGDNLLTVTEVK